MLRAIMILATLLVFLITLSLNRPLLRYWLPITYFIWVYAAVAGVQLMSHLTRRFGLRQAKVSVISRLGVVGLCLAISIYIIGTKPVDRVWDSADVPEYRTDLLQWLRRNVGDDDRYVEGPLFAWQLERGAHLTPAESARENPDTFEQFIRRYDVKYVVVDWDSMNTLRYRGAGSERSGGADRREKLKGIVSFDETRGIVEHELPEGWTRVAADDKGRVEYVVYQIG